MADGADTELVTFTIANLRTISSKRLYALVDVELQVAGLSFRSIGVQVRRGIGGLSVHLPTHRDVNGAWKPVVEMPEELRINCRCLLTAPRSPPRQARRYAVPALIAAAGNKAGMRVLAVAST
jgi:hypothetical protein